jgi:hypothetical protein
VGGDGLGAAESEEVGDELRDGTVFSEYSEWVLEVVGCPRREEVEKGREGRR